MKIEKNIAKKNVDDITRDIQPNIENIDGVGEALKDKVFHEYMKQALVQDFFDELGDYVEPSDLDDMQAELAKVPDEEALSAISLPYELRTRMFQRFEQEVNEGRKPAEVIRLYLERMKKYKFNIGFHTSPHDIRPDPDSGEWQILGTEADHRDSDRMMAYYSSQYRHLFKKRHPNYIYMIRVDPDTEKSDGNWQRNDSLSVIMRVPFEKVVNFVEQTARKNGST